MSQSTKPWMRSSGLGRLLAQENNVSDLLQLLSDRDPAPWADLIGFVPDDVAREVRGQNLADLQLTSNDHRAVVEVKLGHLMSAKQQDDYEALPRDQSLFLAALESDRDRVASASDRWRFLNLGDVIAAWEVVEDDLARLLAGEAASIVRGWDDTVAGVFAPRTQAYKPLSLLNQKFLARVVTRRVAQDLCNRGRLAWAGVTSGGGLPLVQGWTPIRGESHDRCFMAEVRWWETKPGGELRFGIDFDPRPGQDENEEVRRAAYDLARRMDSHLDYASLDSHIRRRDPHLAALLHRDKPSRPKARGDWEQVIVHGFSRAPTSDAAGGNNRRRTSPDFYGDGTLRFQAIADISFDKASAQDLTDLIDATLEYLASRQP